VKLGLNEADTLKSSSLLIYSHSENVIYTQCDRYHAVLIKAVIKISSKLKGVNEMLLIIMNVWKLIMKFKSNAKMLKGT
jgi:hypothetical protein